MTDTPSFPLLDTVLDALEELKARNITSLDVSALTSIADAMVIASGTSSRHVKALADNVVERARAAGYKAIGTEGQQAAEWVLVDLGDIIVHIMQPSVREYYDIERLWRDPAHHPDRQES